MMLLVEYEGRAIETCVRHAEMLERLLALP